MYTCIYTYKYICIYYTITIIHTHTNTHTHTHPHALTYLCYTSSSYHEKNIIYCHSKWYRLVIKIGDFRMGGFLFQKHTTTKVDGARMWQFSGSQPEINTWELLHGLLATGSRTSRTQSFQQTISSQSISER